MKRLCFVGNKFIFRHKQGIVKSAEKPLEKEIEGSGLIHSEEFKVAKKIHADKILKKPKFLSLKL